MASQNTVDLKPPEWEDSQEYDSHHPLYNYQCFDDFGTIFKYTPDSTPATPPSLNMVSPPLAGNVSKPAPLKQSFIKPLIQRRKSARGRVPYPIPNRAPYNTPLTVSSKSNPLRSVSISPHVYSVYAPYASGLDQRNPFDLSNFGLGFGISLPNDLAANPPHSQVISPKQTFSFRRKFISGKQDQIPKKKQEQHQISQQKPSPQPVHLQRSASTTLRKLSNTMSSAVRVRISRLNPQLISHSATSNINPSYDGDNEEDSNSIYYEYNSEEDQFVGMNPILEIENEPRISHDNNSLTASITNNPATGTNGFISNDDLNIPAPLSSISLFPSPPPYPHSTCTPYSSEKLSHELAEAPLLQSAIDSMTRLEVCDSGSTRKSCHTTNAYSSARRSISSSPSRSTQHSGKALSRHRRYQRSSQSKQQYIPPPYS